MALQTAPQLFLRPTAVKVRLLFRVRAVVEETTTTARVLSSQINAIQELTHVLLTSTTTLARTHAGGIQHMDPTLVVQRLVVRLLFTRLHSSTVVLPSLVLKDLLSLDKTLVGQQVFVTVELLQQLTIAPAQLVLLVVLAAAVVPRKRVPLQDLVLTPTVPTAAEE
jgi:hypothetical protein